MKFDAVTSNKNLSVYLISNGVGAVQHLLLSRQLKGQITQRGQCASTAVFRVAPERFSRKYIPELRMHTLKLCKIGIDRSIRAL